jgi:prefoldin subunit 5
MDLQYELGRVAQVNQDIEAANARIAELASEASKLERIGQDVSEIKATLRRCHEMVDHMVRERDKLTLMIAKVLLQ